MQIHSINPKNEQITATFEVTSPQEVTAAIAKAKEAQKKWAKQKKEQRIAILQQIKENFIAEKQSVLAVIESETGYPSEETEPVFFDIIEGFDYYCSRYEKLDNIAFPLDEEIQPQTTAEVQFIPHGVIGHIGVWNYPFWQTMITFIPALLAGNAIVYKPSEYTTATAKKIAKITSQAGLPNNIFTVTPGNKETGKQLVQEDVDALVFTGGSKTGRDIIQHAGIKPLILELSGNDAAIVCADTDLQQAARGICYGTFLHGGQVCIRIKRVYVEQSIAEDFIKELVAYSKKLSFGKELFPLIRKEARDNVHRKVQNATANGAKLLLGGALPEEKGWYYPATILQIEDDKLEIIKEETFGPVCCIRVVKDLPEAIRLANASPLGLGASVWCKEPKKAKQVIQQLEAGNVWVNDSNIPLVCGEYFQGTKSSSIASSQERLMMFLKKKTVIAHNSSNQRDWWF